jgi:hypothetical protein
MLLSGLLQSEDFQLKQIVKNSPTQILPEVILQVA